MQSGVYGAGERDLAQEELARSYGIGEYSVAPPQPPEEVRKSANQLQAQESFDDSVRRSVERLNRYDFEVLYRVVMDERKRREL